MPGSEGKPRVHVLVGPGVPHPAVGRVVADQPRPFGRRAGHHVQVVEVVARNRHRRAVPAVRDEHDVAGAHLGEHVDVSTLVPVDALVGDALADRSRRDLVVVDLLEHTLPFACLVVLVWRVRRPVSSGREHLACDELVGVERLRRGEVVDLPARLAGAPQLDGDSVGGPVAEGQPPLADSRRQREPAALLAADDHGCVARQVDEVTRTGEHVRATLNRERLAVAADPAGAAERQHQHLRLAGRDFG